MDEKLRLHEFIRKDYDLISFGIKYDKELGNNQFLLHSQQPFFVENKNLESLRDEIGRIDSKIVDLFNQRVRAAVEIGRIKNEL